MFEPLAMGTNHMFGVDTYVPLLTPNYEIRIYNMDGSSVTSNSDLLTLSTDEIGEITEESEIITVNYGNGQIKFPSKTTFNDISWTLNCYCSPNVLEALREWRNLVFDPSTEKIGLPSEYFKVAYIVRYDGQGNERDVLRLPGVWLSSLSQGNYSAGSADIVKVSVTLVVSKVIPLTESERA